MAKPMKAPGSTKQGQDPAARKILRIGVIQAGKIVEERLIRRREAVTIGASARNTIVVPASSLPRSFRLFDLQHDRYSLVFNDNMDGRVSVENKVLSLDQIRQSSGAAGKNKQFRLPLDDNARGKVLLGEVTLLFQFVAPPPIQPRPQLPPSVRGSVVGQMDWSLAWSFMGTAVAVTAMVIYIHAMDMPAQVQADVIPEDFAEYLPTVQQPKPKATLDAKAIADVGEKKVEKKKPKRGGGGRKSKKSAGDGKKAPPCDEACQQARAEARRARLREQVANVGALKLLGAKGGKGGAGIATDLLGKGDPGLAAEAAMEGMGGLTTAGTGKGRGLGGRGGGGTGKAVGIGDLGGRVGGPGKVDTGGRVEERVPRAVVKRSGKIERDATLKGDEVARTIRNGMRAVKGCYQRALKRNPRLSGKIAIRLIINAMGRVTDVEIEADSINDSQVTSCIISYAKRWRFPPPEGGGSAEVAVPFFFQAAD